MAWKEWMQRKNDADTLMMMVVEVTQQSSSPICVPVCLRSTILKMSRHNPFIGPEPIPLVQRFVTASSRAMGSTPMQCFAMGPLGKW